MRPVDQMTNKTVHLHFSDEIFAGPLLECMCEYLAVLTCSSKYMASVSYLQGNVVSLDCQNSEQMNKHSLHVQSDNSIFLLCGIHGPKYIQFTRKRELQNHWKKKHK